MAAIELFDRRSQRSVPIALFLIALALLVARFAYAPKQQSTRDLVRWVDPEAAVALARSTGKPILYDFTAEWCEPCHVLDAEVFGEGVAARQINERFIPVRITDRQQEDGRNPPEVDALEKQYSVRGFPTIVFVNASGGEVGRMEGYKGRDELLRIMERVR